jgi:acetyl-CoA acetyltransferase
MTLGSKVAILGVGATPQGKLPNATVLSLGLDALKLALDDAGLEKSRLDGVLTMPGTVSPEHARHYLRFCEAAGIDPRFTGSMIMGGATAGALVQMGAMAINSGLATYVACVFADRAKSEGNKFASVQGGDDPWSIWGMMSPAANSAMGARRHMSLYGTQQRHLGEVAVACRYHASLNPNAVMREPITIEDHANSRPIVAPLNLLDCCLISDGAVAIILGPAERARDFRKPPVVIAGMAQGYTAQNLGRRDWWYVPHQRETVSDAYKMAGVGPEDIDVAQLYDNFSISVLFWLEHAGFCEVGEAGPFVEGGRIRLGGDLPVNTAGGNLSESYMEGWLHIVEGTRQVRGECGPRQVPGVENCLVTGRGMALNTSNAMILRRQ